MNLSRHTVSKVNTAWVFTNFYFSVTWNHRNVPDKPQHVLGFDLCTWHFSPTIRCTKRRGLEVEFCNWDWCEYDFEVTCENDEPSLSLTVNIENQSLYLMHHCTARKNRFLKPSLNRDNLWSNDNNYCTICTSFTYLYLSWKIIYSAENWKTNKNSDPCWQAGVYLVKN